LNLKKGGGDGLKNKSILKKICKENPLQKKKLQKKMIVFPVKVVFRKLLSVIIG